MVKRVIVLAVIIFAVMVAAKDGRLARGMHLTGSCWTASTAADGSQIAACRPGKLEGAPDLSKHGCTLVDQSRTLLHWRCPAAVEASQAGR